MSSDDFDIGSCSGSPPTTPTGSSLGVSTLKKRRNSAPRMGTWNLSRW